MNTPDASRSIVVEREIAHSPEKVWRALTDGSLIEQWLMKNDFKAVVGHKFNFRSDPRPGWNGITDCEVTIVEPNKKLAYAWRSSGAEKADGLDTLVTWTLTPTKTGVMLRMEHSGFRPSDTNFYQGATYGWQKFVSALEGVIAKLT